MFESKIYSCLFLQNGDLNLGECIFMNDVGNCIERNSENDPCFLESDEEDEMKICADCGEEADEFYDDEWLCLDCIVKRDLEGDMNPREKMRKNECDH